MNENPERKIIHCDADCFYAAIEVRDDPSLQGRPIAVGGSADRRGVISTCNYEARRYGVRSALPTFKARELCPELILMPHRFDVYREASRQIKEIFYEYTELVEPLSLDEAFLDVSREGHCHGSATLMAKEIRERVERSVGITVSAGVAPNKFLAKVGSDWNKPNGLFVLTPSEVGGFVEQLPVSCVFGVGKVTAEKMAQMGIKVCGDLRRFTVFELAERFGSFGNRLYELCRGIDHRPVQPTHRRKSLSVEHTYPMDLQNVEKCLEQLSALIVELNARLQKLDADYQIVKQFVKIKFNNFQTTTVECVSGQARISVFNDLCRKAYGRGGLPVRLLGLGVRLHDLKAERNPFQLSLFNDE